MIDLARLSVRNAFIACVPFNQRKPIQLTRTITAFSRSASSQVRLIEDKDLFIVALF